MQPRDVLPVLRKHWVLIVGVVGVAVIASYLFARLQTPIYRATAFLTVSPSRMDYGQTLTIENVIRQYARQIQTDRLAEEVNDALKLDLPIERLRSKMKAAAVMDDLTLKLEVDDTDPTRARDVAVTWARKFVELHQNRMASVEPRDRIEIDLLDRPPPADLNWPRRNQIMLAAAILGLMVGVALAFALEYLDDTLKTPGDVDRYVKAPLLAAIPGGDGPGLGGANGHHRRPRLPSMPGSRRA